MTEMILMNSLVSVSPWPLSSEVLRLGRQRGLELDVVSLNSGLKGNWLRAQQLLVAFKELQSDLITSNTLLALVSWQRAVWMLRRRFNRRASLLSRNSISTVLLTILIYIDISIILLLHSTFIVDILFSSYVSLTSSLLFSSLLFSSLLFSSLLGRTSLNTALSVMGRTGDWSKALRQLDMARRCGFADEISYNAAMSAGEKGAWTSSYNMIYPLISCHIMI